ncbi:MAG: TonB-dependent receptor, partial [Tannerellaceae bacterium]|nr:TonB-dependent receptor [Tannerellaceae bacterium]
MKKNNYIKAFTIATLLFVSLSMQAQEDTTNLNREMTLEREYDPSVQDANKVNTLPEIKDPEIRKMPIDYAGITFPAFPGKEAGALHSGNILTNMEYNKRKGYLNLAGGMNMNLNGDLGYHILNTVKDQLNISLSHRSANGNVKYIQTDEKQKMMFNDNLGGINYRRRFNKAIMRLGAKYGYSTFNYYGYADALLPFPTITGYALTPGQAVTDRETNQVNQLIHVYAGVTSTEESAIGYDTEINYTNFSYKYGLEKSYDGPKENRIAANINVYFPVLTDQWLGAQAKINYFNYSTPSVYYSLPSYDITYDFQNYAEVTLSPYYKIAGGNWNILLGANVMLYTGEWEKNFMASPNIAFDVEMGGRTVLYGEAKGELKSNSLYELARESRYVNYQGSIEPSRNILNATAGIKSGALPGFWFDVFGGYKYTTGDYFLLPPTFIFVENAFNQLGIMNEIDTELIFGGIELKYSYRKYFDLHLKGVYNKWNSELGNGW